MKKQMKNNWENELLGAIARGWCTERNSKKIMDADLALDIGEEVKSFIKQEIAREKMELVERIEKMRKELVSPRTNDMTNLAFINYNQALKDVLSALKSEEKEEVGEE